MSILSSTIVNFAVILWLSMETGSARMLAYATIAALLPQAVLGPVSGVFIDRWNRKRTMIAADSFIALCTLILAVLFMLGTAKMWHIFILLGLRSVGSAFHMPAMQASVPLLAPAEELTRVAGVNQMIASVCNIAGPALGALFITIWDMQYVLMLDVAGAILACTSLLFVHIPNPERHTEKVKDVLHEMREGVRHILRKRGLAWIFLFSVVVTFFLMPVSVLFPLMTLDHFGGGAYQVSLIEAIWGAGALLGGAIMGARKWNVRNVVLVNLMYIALGIMFIASGLLSPGAFVWFVALTAFSGITGAVYNSAFTAIVQTNVDPAVLGRVFSIFFSLSILPSMAGIVGIGFFADGLGLTTTFILCGTVIMLTGVAAFLTPSAMKIK